MLDIDTAIKHCLEVAEKNDGEAEVYDLLAKNHNNTYEKLTASRFYADCAECAAEHRQLAEWLTELKDLRAEQHEQCVYIKELMKHSASDECGQWIDTHGTYIDELDGWYMESKCSLCGKYTVSYEKYGVHQKCEYCSHCGNPMK